MSLNSIEFRHPNLCLNSSTIDCSQSSMDLSKKWIELRKDLNQRVSSFYDAPIQPDISQIESIQSTSRRLRSEKNIKTCLFIGIGGSSLGPKSLLSALPFNHQVEVRFLENPDPDDWKLKTADLDPKHTLVVAVTKSGSTFETLSLLLITLEWLGKERWKNQVIVITDPQSGELRQFAETNSLESLSIDPNLGGRFSIFSPVGLLALSLVGHDPVKFLSGALSMRESFEKTPPNENAIFKLSDFFIQNFEKYPMHVLMPYVSHLKEFSEWWIQLWAESLGKNEKGFTPLSALGAIDQHSLLQLFNEGPKNKVFMFIDLEKRNHSIKIPKMTQHSKDQYSTIKLLEGHTIEGLLKTELNATSRVFEQKSIPSITLSLSELNESTLGSLYFLFCTWTAYLGYAWELNPFDQPGVETGKNIVREALKVDAPTHSL